MLEIAFDYIAPGALAGLIALVLLIRLALLPLGSRHPACPSLPSKGTQQRTIKLSDHRQAANSRQRAVNNINQDEALAEAARTFLEELRSVQSQEQIVAIQIELDDGPTLNSRPILIDGSGNPLRVVSVNIKNGLVDSKINLRNLRVDKLFVSGSAGLTLTISDCSVRFLEVANGSSTHPGLGRCFIGNSNIGDFELKSFSVGSLDLKRTRIGRVKSTSSAINVSLSVDASNELADFTRGASNEEIQQYRGLRISAAGKCDELTEKLIHATELRLERSNGEPLAFKLLNFAYDACSFYGNNPHRALGIVAVIAFLVSPFALFDCDCIAIPESCQVKSDQKSAIGSEVNVPADQSINGWREVLCDGGYSGRLARSYMASIQSTTNPFSSLSTSKTALAAKSITAAFGLCLVGLLNITLLAIAAIGIRRRFKLS